MHYTLAELANIHVVWLSIHSLHVDRVVIISPGRFHGVLLAERAMSSVLINNTSTRR